MNRRSLSASLRAKVLRGARDLHALLVAGDLAEVALVVRVEQRAELLLRVRDEAAVLHHRVVVLSTFKFTFKFRFTFKFE